jgi:hypothetical protein
MCATLEQPPLLVPCNFSWEKSHGTALRWVTGPSVVSPGRDGQCADRSQVAVALSAAVGCDHLTVPVSGAFAVGAGPTASKQLHVTWASVEGWRSIATGDDSKLRG